MRDHVPEPVKGDTETKLPEYCSTSIGKVDLGSVTNRLRDMAALLVAQGLSEAADHLVAAIGVISARRAVPVDKAA